MTSFSSLKGGGAEGGRYERRDHQVRTTEVVRGLLPWLLPWYFKQQLLSSEWAGGD